MSRILMTVGAVAVASIAAVSPAQAQDETVLRSFFEGRRVTLKIDMPATSDGVDLNVDANRPLDTGRYGNRLKAFGTAIHAGESSVVTLVKVKRDLVEFQLGGGGFGTFGDDTNTSVYIPPAEPSERERELERNIREESDPRLRREMEHDLDELRERRERENRRIEAERADAEARKRELVAERRLSGGSRFNLRYDRSVPSGLQPGQVMAALAEYVDFSAAAGPVAPPPLAPPNTVAIDDAPRKGMSRAEAEGAFGLAVEVHDRREGALTVTTARFVRRDQQIVAEFVEDVLIRFSVTSR